MNLTRQAVIEGLADNTMRGYYAYLFLTPEGGRVILRKDKLGYIDMVDKFGEWIKKAVGVGIVEIFEWEEEWEFEEPTYNFIDYLRVGNWKSVTLKLLI